MTEEERRRRALEQYLYNTPGLKITSFAGPRQQQQAPPRTPAPKQSFGNKFRDIFDANTQADQWRRQQKGQSQFSQTPGNLGTQTVRFATDWLRPAAQGLTELVTHGTGLGSEQLLKQQKRASSQDLSNILMYSKLYREGKMSPQAYSRALQQAGQDAPGANALSKQVQETADKSRFLGSAAQAGLAPFLGAGRAGVGLTGKVVSGKSIPLATKGFRYGRNAAEGLAEGVFSEFSENKDPTLKGAATKGAFGTVIGGAAEPVVGVVGKVFKKITNPTTKRIANTSDIGKIAEELYQKYPDADPNKLAELAQTLTGQNKSRQVKQTLRDFEKNGAVSNIPKPEEATQTPKSTQAKRPAPKSTTERTGTITNDAGITASIKLLDNGNMVLTKDLVHDGKVVAKAGATEINGIPLTVGGQADYFIKTGELKLDPPSTPVETSVAKEVPTNAPAPVKETATPSTSADLAQAQVNKIPDDIQQKIQNGEAITPEDLNKAMEVEGATTATKSEGFKGNIETTPFKNVRTAQDVVDALTEGKRITNKKTLEKAADKIAKNPSAAFADIVTKKQLTSADDVATGNLLLREAIERGDVEAAIQIGTKMNIDGRKLGQAVQAYATLKKTTPEGIVTYASKKALNAGKELDPAVAESLIAKANQIADMPESLEKAKAIRELLGEADSVGRGWKENVQEILSTPRAAMATADLSAPLRQGAVLGTRFPKEFAKASGEAVTYFGSPGAYEKAMYEISQRPTYALMKKSKLAVSGAEQLTGTEEQFMKNILESDVAKKLGVGHVVAASDRGYTGFLTKFRADVFDKIIKDSADAGVELDTKALESLAKFINSASGRGSGKLLDKHAGLLSQALFSPKLWKSRLDILNPVYYARLDPVARKYALQATASFGSVAFTVLGLAALAGASVEWDPRSADFAKIKVGNTRYDILGGLQQNIRLGAQLATGQKINSTTGELQDLGPDRGFGKPSRLDLLYQFVENKENPVLGFATKALRGTDPAGNPINLASEAGNLFIPLTAQGVYDTAKDQGSLAKGIAMNIPGMFGIGVQTYSKNPTTFGTGTTSGKSTVREHVEAQLGKAKVAVDGKQVDYLKLKDDQKKELARTNPDVRNFYEQEQEIERIFKTPALRPDGLSPESTKLLNAYDRRTANQKDEVFSRQKDAEFKYEQAKYEEDKLQGDISRTDEIKRQKKLAKLSVSSGWEKPVRDIYSLTLSDIKDLVAEDPNGEELFGQLRSLDNALFDAGVIKTHKFKDPSGGRKFASVRSGGRSNSGTGGRRSGSEAGPDPTKKRMGLEELLSSIKASGFKVPDFATTPQRRVFKVNLPAPAKRKSKARIKI